ncbi:hypothetical protein WICMUC_000408 [Wickerhamomyces mucosus]|uniref:Uncharacterized protein n=1 Tax=Wickerhamomyces mucosus TaxID=1378264 RepID=A0A9P8TIS2_9ASCO|nr:hypothetical protein WICMUC_000408 [Wickerhamomyces mucosus]
MNSNCDPGLSNLFIYHIPYFPSARELNDKDLNALLRHLHMITMDANLVEFCNSSDFRTRFLQDYVEWCIVYKQLDKLEYGTEIGLEYITSVVLANIKYSISNENVLALIQQKTLTELFECVDELQKILGNNKFSESFNDDDIMFFAKSIDQIKEKNFKDVVDEVQKIESYRDTLINRYKTSTTNDFSSVSDSLPSQSLSSQVESARLKVPERTVANTVNEEQESILSSSAPSDSIEQNTRSYEEANIQSQITSKSHKASGLTTVQVRATQSPILKIRIPQSYRNDIDITDIDIPRSDGPDITDIDIPRSDGADVPMENLHRGVSSEIADMRLQELKDLWSGQVQQYQKELKDHIDNSIKIANDKFDLLSDFFDRKIYTNHEALKNLKTELTNGSKLVNDDLKQLKDDKISDHRSQRHMIQRISELTESFNTTIANVDCVKKNLDSFQLHSEGRFLKTDETVASIKDELQKLSKSISDHSSIDLENLKQQLSKISFDLQNIEELTRHRNDQETFSLEKETNLLNKNIENTQKEQLNIINDFKEHSKASLKSLEIEYYNKLEIVKAQILAELESKIQQASKSQIDHFLSENSHLFSQLVSRLARSQTDLENILNLRISDVNTTITNILSENGAVSDLIKRETAPNTLLITKHGIVINDIEKELRAMKDNIDNTRSLEDPLKKVQKTASELSRDLSSLQDHQQRSGMDSELLNMVVEKVRNLQDQYKKFTSEIENEINKSTVIEDLNSRVAFLVQKVGSFNFNDIKESIDYIKQQQDLFDAKFVTQFRSVCDSELSSILGSNPEFRNLSKKFQELEKHTIAACNSQEDSLCRLDERVTRAEVSNDIKFRELETNNRSLNFEHVVRGNGAGSISVTESLKKSFNDRASQIEEMTKEKFNDFELKIKERLEKVSHSNISSIKDRSEELMNKIKQMERNQESIRNNVWDKDDLEATIKKILMKVNSTIGKTNDLKHASGKIEGMIASLKKDHKELTEAAGKPTAVSKSITSTMNISDKETIANLRRELNSLREYSSSNRSDFEIGQKFLSEKIRLFDKKIEETNAVQKENIFLKSKIIKLETEAQLDKGRLGRMERRLSEINSLLKGRGDLGQQQRLVDKSSSPKAQSAIGKTQNASSHLISAPSFSPQSHESTPTRSTNDNTQKRDASTVDIGAIDQEKQLKKLKQIRLYKSEPSSNSPLFL